MPVPAGSRAEAVLERQRSSEKLDGPGSAMQYFTAGEAQAGLNQALLAPLATSPAGAGGGGAWGGGAGAGAQHGRRQFALPKVLCPVSFRLLQTRKFSVPMTA